MGRLTSDVGVYEYQWASDVSFDGIRLEVFSEKGDILFDVSVPDHGAVMVNTFSSDVPAPLITEAVSLAEQRA